MTIDVTDEPELVREIWRFRAQAPDRNASRRRARSEQVLREMLVERLLQELQGALPEAERAALVELPRRQHCARRDFISCARGDRRGRGGEPGYLRRAPLSLLSPPFRGGALAA